MPTNNKEIKTGIIRKYKDLLKEVRTKLVEFRLFTARDYVPRMYYMLLEENLEFTPENARDRIEKDCRGIWSKRTIGKFLPDEAKNSKKVKAGRLRKKKPICAAISAAQRGKQEVITIDNMGKSYIENPVDSSSLKQPDIDLVLGDDNSKPLLDFEFALKFKDVQQYMAKLYPSVGDSGIVWFSGIVDRNTGTVTHARLGKRNIENDLNVDRNNSNQFDDNLDDNDITI